MALWVGKLYSDVSEAKLSMKMCCLLQLIFSRSATAVARLIFTDASKLLILLWSVSCT
ncbi:hypothetical protein OsI_25382 [Oryza sativa Indica Group]|uniref:Uncharacterized protein n=1 Tax=Oryza sativa subsp. indica TaxID=39946 RepID=B8B8F8_ORYSI|nr:hypothetical protein OsI_25382 [Oryza sativa Indica Group]